VEAIAPLPILYLIHIPMHLKNHINYIFSPIWGEMSEGQRGLDEDESITEQ